jgi:hypothetical protein
VIPHSTWPSTEVSVTTSAASIHHSRANSPDKPRTDIDKSRTGGKGSSKALTSCIEEEEREIKASLYQEEDEHQSPFSNSVPPSLFEDSYSPDDLEIQRGLIFGGIPTLREVDLRDKALHMAVMRYHRRYNPLTDYNPLLNFGAVDGVLPGCTLEASMLIRDVLIRWESPHLELEWNSLTEAVTLLTEKQFRPDELHKWMEEGLSYYSLPKNHLLSLTHIVLALHQIL